ncbi:STAS domain-containing protein [Streptomyces sp. JV176]|uniref:STAS domain-containing protein n=1 Tax=Streptomyces sp. JV176 TaxID=858630 RepID=UPI002E79B663|nr:STAS domain-containing protein [Streptomyces sp. JV176]MEE1799399.1 STAS domain-containing protein [Streptomyces sp. JV176]
MRVATGQNGDAVVVTVSGDLDVENIAPLVTALTEAGESATGPVVVDLSRITFADSTTVNVLLQAHGTLGPRLRLAQPSSFVQRLFDVIGLEQAVPVYATIEAALASEGAAGAPADGTDAAG